MERLAPAGRHAFVHEGRKVYEWDQSLTDVNVYVEVPPGVRARDMFCDIERQHVRFGIKGNPPFLDVSELAVICTWSSTGRGRSASCGSGDQRRLLARRRDGSVLPPACC